jgi:amino acid permease
VDRATSHHILFHLSAGSIDSFSLSLWLSSSLPASLLSYPLSLSLAVFVSLPGSLLTSPLSLSPCLSHLNSSQKLFFVYNCLRRRSVARIRHAITASHCFVGIMYLLFGVLAALNSTRASDTDLTLNYFAHYGAVEGPKLVYEITRSARLVSQPPVLL